MGEGVHCVTVEVSVWSGSECADHTNVYGMVMLNNDSIEGTVSWWSPGGEALFPSLMKGPIGYVSVVVGGTEVASLVSVTGYGSCHGNFGPVELTLESGSCFAVEMEVVVANLASLNLPGPGGNRLLSTPVKRRHMLTVQYWVWSRVVILRLRPLKRTRGGGRVVLRSWVRLLVLNCRRNLVYGC